MRNIIFLFGFFLISCSVGTDEANKEKINQMLDEWHHSAAIADEKVYFDAFSDNGIFIGTDATEHWTVGEFKEWSKEFFEKDTAWAFTKIERNIEFSNDGKIAWFDELLDTWMGTCRASGVLQKEGNDWKIEHYHLSIAVPNELVDEYVKLIKKN